MGVQKLLGKLANCLKVVARAVDFIAKRLGMEKKDEAEEH